MMTKHWTPLIASLLKLNGTASLTLGWTTKWKKYSGTFLGGAKNGVLEHQKP